MTTVFLISAPSTGESNNLDPRRVSSTICYGADACGAFSNPGN